MRMTYLLPPVLALMLVGCGPDEEAEREVTPPTPTTEQPAAPADDVTVPDTTEPVPGTGTSSGNSTMDSGTGGGVTTPPADNGSGLGTESGSGTAPNTGTGTGTGTGASQ